MNVTSLCTVAIKEAPDWELLKVGIGGISIALELAMTFFIYLSGFQYIRYIDNISAIMVYKALSL